MMVGQFLVLKGACQFGSGVSGLAINFIHSFCPKLDDGRSPRMRASRALPAYGHSNEFTGGYNSPVFRVCAGPLREVHARLTEHAATGLRSSHPGFWPAGVGLGSGLVRHARRDRARPQRPPAPTSARPIPRRAT